MTITKFENLESDYDRVQNLKAQNLKLESEIKELKKRQMTPLLFENKKLKDEKEALVKLSNKRYDQIASLQITNSEALRLREENLKLESQNKDLTNALKSSLSQIAYLFETVKTFDADFFKIKGFNDDSSEKDK